MRELTVRSAFRVTQPDNLCDTHLLQLCSSTMSHLPTFANASSWWPLESPRSRKTSIRRRSRFAICCPRCWEARERASKAPNAKQMIVLFFVTHYISGMHADIRTSPRVSSKDSSR